MHHRTPSGCCEKDIGSSRAHIPHYCEHKELYVYTKQIKRSAPLRRVSEKRMGEVRHRGSTLKQGKGFAVTKAQRDKVRDQYCLSCGRDPAEAKIDPAHLWPRGMGGCDAADCVVPLCRDCHRLYDAHKLDLLPALLAGGFWTELAHPTAAHEVSPTVLVERLTSQRYVPVDVNEIDVASAVSTAFPSRK
jgi:hypothetical protein